MTKNATVHVKQRNAAPLFTKMPSISDIALGGYAVVATGLTVALMVQHAA